MILLFSDGLIFPIIFALIIFVLWIEWIIGVLIGKNVSRMTGIIVGIVLIVLGFSFLTGIACIVYSQRHANAPIDITAHINNDRQSSLYDDDTTKCPHCAETIKKNAKICRYCNREL